MIAHNLANAYDLFDLIIPFLAGLILITTLCFIINFSYKELIAENTNCTTHNHGVGEQTNNKDCNTSKSLPAKDKYINENNTYIQVNCGVPNCKQCKPIVKHESIPADSISNEHSHKESEVHKEENIHKEIISSKIPTEEEEPTSIDEQLICNIPNCIHCTNSSK